MLLLNKECSIYLPSMKTMPCYCLIRNVQLFDFYEDNTMLLLKLFDCYEVNSMLLLTKECRIIWPLLMFAFKKNML